MSNDEKLNRLLDNELDAKERADMEATLAGDATLQAKLTQMQHADNLVRTAFSGPMKGVVPDRFLNAIDAGLAAREVPVERNVIPISPSVNLASNDNSKSWWRIGAAVAASLVIGLVFGSQLTTGGSGTASVALNKALSAVPSGQTASLAPGESITPQLSFAQAGGGYCRQFTLLGTSGAKSGLACRKGGDWSVEALMPTNAGSSAEGDYVTAEGPSGGGIEAVINTRRAGDPLDKAAEAKIIAQGWK